MDTILLVDDDDDIATLLQYSISKAALELSLQRTSTVKEAIQYLSGQGEYHDRQQFPFPCAVLLDMRLPGEKGETFLEWKREQPELKSLPIAVWSGSEWSKEKDKAYELGAALYIPKPIHVFSFAEILQSIKELCAQKRHGTTGPSS